YPHRSAVSMFHLRWPRFARLRLSGQPHAPNRPASPPRRTRARRAHTPHLEALEDRTVLSPTLVTEIKDTTASSDPSNLVNVNGALYFTANDGAHGTQLWKSDGSAAGTVMLTDLNEGGFNPGSLTDVNGTLFFTANDGIHGTELWKSD